MEPREVFQPVRSQGTLVPGGAEVHPPARIQKSGMPPTTVPSVVPSDPPVTPAEELQDCCALP